MKTPRIVHRITVSSGKVPEALTFALIADLHSAPYDDLLPVLHEADAILILGDLVNRHRPDFSFALRFLNDAPMIAPTFYAIGNHEWKFPRRSEYWSHVLRSHARLLDNTFTPFRGVVLGGFSSASPSQINASFLPDMATQAGFKLLMCHHPELYAPYVAPLDIDLTLSGHAHGGQIQLFGRGLYAPGQGLFPKLTHGFYDGGRLLVSRGLTNSSGFPRWNNPCELIMLHLTPKEE